MAGDAVLGVYVHLGVCVCAGIESSSIFCVYTSTLCLSFFNLIPLLSPALLSLSLTIADFWPSFFVFFLHPVLKNILSVFFFEKDELDLYCQEKVNHCRQ